MPELPEVEVSRMGITPHMLLKTIRTVRVHHWQLRWPVPKEMEQLAGQTITAIERRAKYLQLVTPIGTVILHLGMSGNLRIVDKAVALKKHDHIEIELESGLVLRLNDPRRFGACLWQAPGETHSVFAKLGPEPLTDAFNPEQLFEQAKNKKTAIKQFIMDNKFVVGVGNIYANEALFKAKIHPQTPAGQLQLADFVALVPIIKQTLAQAITQGGTTLKDFAQTDGKPGYFAQELQVYGRKGKPCVQCDTVLLEIRLGQRSTVFCPSCQLAI
ncbi:bifunctional DNA-formamidopyrimidine glycosylase/DNA-(apurinic or apyrimidinic site) lyase [Pseudoalteromonas tunicata]|uniref:Formamidopyrimidine-DNA glycosylase n=1 Tax=Pseudoalteromonas tunicata D2 TaxID=87626 RepID=A4CAZ3_9GAMM|nr:bifunctional DNA-formamidopyrimidine glycosylase/DNA-(apurinic or apyrimidinic site) lyase [Pseudoalteromonas tunicata]ATC95094.1 formamidopyrimidine-DNA glycosylase [Pseudoalteromonas tunicata]AXT30729.1 bifunctional DNA-formamidopyrimidine glycosylase/DNA-(apurinic or apyrimidinic site) lyase [Pseudoalteromonas tunicata]EAR28551.1 formamidopyrimidine DNA glycosylase [Pseudoalteromonas tunicata D2]MDP4985768.1 bifunctional DNA-formamidopyrimidine glycosylase/DNA-(apurinic or apyrimidinic si